MEALARFQYHYCSIDIKNFHLIQSADISFKASMVRLCNRQRWDLAVSRSYFKTCMVRLSWYTFMGATGEEQFQCLNGSIKSAIFREWAVLYGTASNPWGDWWGSGKSKAEETMLYLEFNPRDFFQCPNGAISHPWRLVLWDMQRHFNTCLVRLNQILGGADSDNSGAISMPL